MQLYVLIHDENLGTETCWKNFSKMKEAEQYMKDVNELNGVRAELKVMGAKHNANLWVDFHWCYSSLLVCGLFDLQKRWVEVLDTQEVLPI